MRAVTGPGRALILADIEGIAGVDDYWRDLAAGVPGYERACDLMTGEVAAAVRGLAAAGASDVIVIDAHSSGRNIRRDDLPAPARFLDVPGAKNQIDAAFAAELDAVVLLGFHAAAGTPGGFMPHSFHVDTRSWINGTLVGEPSMLALHAGMHGVPVILNAGDQYTVAQTAEVSPGTPWVQTKTSTSTWTARSRDPEEVRAAIERAAADGWARRGAIPLATTTEPVELLLQARNRVGYQLLAAIPRTEPAPLENAVVFRGPWDEMLDFFVVANTVVSFLSWTGSSYYFGPIEDGLVPRLSRLPGADEIRRDWVAWWFQPPWAEEGGER
ncbi:MAG: M55 family metallopeptidase [Thermomicrobiaceae bacterium]|nr:M55 family metallopeptidase [Thermomicrobiaceae bacterium]